MPLALAVLLATLAFAASPLFVPDFGGFDADQFPIPQDDPPVQPAGYAFAIWGLIYLWLLISAGFGVAARARAHDWAPMRPWLLASLVVGAAWLAVAVRSPVWAAVLIWLMLITALIALARAPRGDLAWAAWPVGLYAGWLSAASVVALGLLAAGYGLMSGVAAGYAGIAVASVLAFAVQWRLGRAPTYGAAAIWALVAVAVQNGGEAGLVAAALAGAGLVAVPTVQAARA
ncbi:MAG: hypothetical protein AAGF60_16295 [Pseudomonadota bacterium]